MAKRQVLRLVKERKLADLLQPPRPDAVFEASGVITRHGYAFVVLDNVRRIARIALHMRRKSRDHGWAGGERQGEGYEAITYGSGAGRFYLMIEAQKHPDGTFKSVIEEFDESWRYTGRTWVDLRSRKETPASKGSHRCTPAGTITCLRSAKGTAAARATGISSTAEDAFM